MATITGYTAEKTDELLAVKVNATAKVLTATLEDLASGDGAFGSFDIGHAFRLDKIVSNKPCRFRVYASGIYRTSDGDRPRDEDPQGDHGVIAEIILTPD